MEKELSILIPARNEMFLKQTIENIIENKEANTEIIAILDGYWPEPSIEDHPDVILVHHTTSIGQRAATNEAARLSQAKYIMKVDAHCAFDKGFDKKLINDCEYDWTVVPRMYNLHAFDWKCKKCGNQTYQGPTPKKCDKCDNTTDFERVIIWKPRLNRRSDFARFDNTLHFQYWHDYEKRPESKHDIADLMCHVGAGWFMHRERYWELGGMDENHGSWGQMGVEVSCKTWLSGGRQVVNKKTWYAHMFRTQGDDFGFPYPLSGKQVDNARKRSKWLWEGNNWEKAVRPFSWILEKFAPIPTWDEPIEKVEQKEIQKDFVQSKIVESIPTNIDFIIKKDTKGIVYYTDNRLEENIFTSCQDRLYKSANGIPIVAVSLKPIDCFETNIVIDAERSHITMFNQILAGIEECDTDIIFLAEHDLLYHPSHFDFLPPSKEVYYYNENTWKVRSSDGQALFYYCQQTSGCCAHRELLLQHYQKRIEIIKQLGRYPRNMGYEPGVHQPPRGVDNYKALSWFSVYPNIDIRHNSNLTPNRFNQDLFRNKKHCQGWTLSDEVPYWGVTKNRFNEFLNEVKEK